MSELTEDNKLLHRLRSIQDRKEAAVLAAKDAQIAALREALMRTLAWTKEYREDYSDVPAECERVDDAITAAIAALEMSGGSAP